MKASNLEKALDLCFKTKRAAMIWGSPGVGKSAIVAAMATKRNWQLLDFRLVMRDAVDMRGVPFVAKDGRTQWAVPAEFPKEGTKGIWLLDEVNAAHPQVQVVAYQLTHDRAVGEYKVPDGWVIVMAGNKEDDGAVTHKMSTALSSRVVHLDLDVDNDDWLEWARGAGVADEIRAFIKFRPHLLHQFEPKKKERSFPCPRTWEIASDIVKLKPAPEVEHELFEGTVGKGAAVELSAFIRSWRAMPDLDNIIANPTTAYVPSDQTEIGTLYAVASALPMKATLKNWNNIVTYLERLPVEFNVMAVRDAVHRNKSLIQTGGIFNAWCLRHADVNMVTV